MRTWCRRAAVGFIAAAGGAGAAVALAAGPAPTSQTLTINGDQVGPGFAPSVAMRADGGFAVAYARNPDDSFDKELFLRRYGADDVPAAAPQPVAPADAARRYEPDYAVDPTTGAGVVVYQRSTGGIDTIWAQRLAADGAPVGVEIQVDPGADGDTQSFPKVVVASGGAFAVSWREGSIIRLQRFSATGGERGGGVPAGGVDIGAVLSSPIPPAYDLAMNAAGEFVMVWGRQTFGQASRLFARRFDAAGASSGEFVVASLAPPPPGGFAGQYLDPSVAIADSGAAVVVFHQTTGGGPRVRATRIGAPTDPLAPVTAIAEADFNSDLDPEISMDAAGNAVVVWERQNVPTANRSSLWVREFAPNLTPLDGESLVAQNLDLAGPRATVASRSGQRPVVAWETGGGIFARRLVFTPGGTPTTTTGTTTSTPTTAPPAGTTSVAGTTPPGTTQALTTPTTPIPPTARPPLPTFANAATLPSAARCVSRRSFRIRIKRLPGGTRIVRAEVRVNGKRVKVVTGSRLTAPVDLRGLPKGRFTVQLRVRTADGRQLTGTRRYRTCVPRRAGGSTGPL